MLYVVKRMLLHQQQLDRCYFCQNCASRNQPPLNTHPQLTRNDTITRRPTARRELRYNFKNSQLMSDVHSMFRYFQVACVCSVCFEKHHSTRAGGARLVARYSCSTNFPKACSQRVYFVPYCAFD